MKKLLFRFLAYFIDFVVIILVSNLIVLAIPPLRKINDVAADYTEKYFKYNQVYREVVKKVEDAYEDNKLTPEESIDLNNEYKEYSKLIKTVNVETEVKDEDLDKLLEELQKENVEKNNEYIYKVNKKSVIANAIKIGVGIIYLGVIQFLLKGYTLGKKLLRLRTISNDNKEISLIKYIIRSILVTEALLIGSDAIVISVVGFNSYLSYSGVMSYVRYFYELAFMICIVARNDQKSVHDLLLNTRVALFDKEGNEVESIVFAEIPQEPVKPQEVKEVKKTTKTKTTTKKTTKKEKEVVKAEKVK